MKIRKELWFGFVLMALIVAATLAVILLVGAAATPDWRLW